MVAKPEKIQAYFIPIFGAFLRIDFQTRHNKNKYFKKREILKHTLQFPKHSGDFQNRKSTYKIFSIHCKKWL